VDQSAHIDRIVGADSLTQPAGDSEDVGARPPREISDEMMQSRLDPLIQHTSEHVELARGDMADLTFENTLIDPDPMIGHGGLGDFKGDPDDLGSGPDPRMAEEEEGDDIQP
jgi:hypothetical protein